MLTDREIECIRDFEAVIGELGSVEIRPDGIILTMGVLVAGRIRRACYAIARTLLARAQYPDIVISSAIDACRAKLAGA